MANRRRLKKNIDYIMQDLLIECFYRSESLSDKTKAEELMNEIALVNQDYITRISHTEPGNVKGFYKKLRSEFEAKAEELIAKIMEL